MKEENMNENIQPATMQMNVPEQIQPIIEAPVAPQMVEQTPVMEAPAAPQMVEQTPVMEAPAAPQMVEQTPVMEAPAAPQMVEQTPVMEAPAAPQMVEQTPVMESAVPQMVEQPMMGVNPIGGEQVISPVQMTDPNQIGMMPTNNMMASSPVSGPTPTGTAKKGKGKVIVVAVLLAIVVIGLGIFGFLTLKNYNNPRTRFLKSMEKYSEKNQLAAATKNVNNIMKKGANLKLDSTLKLKVGEEEFVNGKMNLKFIDNPTVKQQYYNIILSNNDEEIIDVEGLLKEDKFYFKLKEVFERFYYIDGVDYDMLTELYRKDTTQLEKVITDTMLQYFTEDKFVSSDEKINVNGKEKNTMRITITISEKDLGDFCKLFFTNLLNNKEALNAFVTEDLTLEDIKESFQDSIDSINDAYSEMDTTPILTYIANLDKYEIVRQIITSEEVKLTIEGMENGRITLNVAGVDYVTGTFSKNNLKLNLNVTGMGSVNLDITYQENITPTNVDANYNITVTADISGTKIEVTSTIAMKVDNQNTIPNVDLSDSKSVEDVTEKELEDIQEKIMDLPYIGDLIEDYNERVYSSVTDPSYGLDDFNNEYGDDFEVDYYDSELYSTFSNYEEFDSVVKGNKLTMIVLGRSTCTYCNQFVMEINSVLEDNNANIYYIDSENFNSVEYNKILNSNLTVPARCGSVGTEFKLIDGFGTPLTIFTRNGRVEDCISGYVDKSTLLTKLTGLGMLNPSL